jgi:predicted RNase H-like nuclease (RuvC/YqgF family)
MEKIKEVVEARALMTEAMDWPVMKWLTEKRRVRKTADLANATLDRVEAELQSAWDPQLKAAFDGKNGIARSPELERHAKQLRDAHDAAIKGRMEAEETFEKAEKRLSTSLAREGCHKAIAGWDLHEDAIRRAELAANKK